MSDLNGGDQSAPRNPADLTLTTVGQVIGLFVVLVPLCGYLGFLIFFSINSRLWSYDVFNIAIDRSIPSLATIGGMILFFSLFAIFLEHFGAPRRDSSPDMRKRRLRVVLIGGAVVLLILLLFVNAYFAISFLVYIPIFGWSYSKWRVGNTISFRSLWRPLSILVFMSSLLVAVFLITMDTGYVRFTQSAGIRGGYYTIVGSSGDQELLLPCAMNKPLISVSDQTLVSIVYEKTKESFGSQGLINILESGTWPSLESGSNSCPNN